ncbi:TonB-dependent receptor plug domain-containing protein [Prosthecobacter sp.]|uniref:TonB-dependent receptor plug domain-containing protein n=1 Tax=Prosthecobacter sp. TaxID=1965333 RepID=UPI0037830AFE
MAQKPPSQKEGESEELPTVVITASRTATDQKKVPQSTNVVEQKRIERFQATTPSEMLQEQPGVWVNQVAAQGSPVIRGQMGNKLVYLWDGIRINNGAIFSGPNPFFNQFPIDAMGRMEVVRGAGSVQYGSDAIGGVINVFSKRGEFSESLNVGGDVYSRYGSNNSEFTNAANVHASNKEWAFSAGWSAQDVGNYHTSTGPLQPTGFHASGGYANLAYQPVKGHIFRLSWVGNERTDVKSYVQSQLNANGVPRIYSPLERRGIVKMDYTAEDLGFLSKELKVYGYYQYYDQLRERRVQTSTLFNNTITNSDQDVWGVGIQNAATWGENTRLVIGMDYRHENLSSSQMLNSRVISTGVTTVSQPAGITPDGTYAVFDTFVTLDFKPTDKLLMNVGARYENTHLHSNPELMDVIPGAGYTLSDLMANKYWNAVTWNVGAVYQATKSFDLVANVATGYRTPTYSDLLSAGTPVFSSLTASLPSTTINPERSITYELAARVHTEKFKGSITGYLTKLSDIITSTTSGTVVIGGVTYTATRNANSAKGYITGVELALNYDLDQHFSVFNNTTWTYGQNQSQNVPLRFIPPLYGNFGIRFESDEKRYWVELSELWAGPLIRHNPSDEIDAGFSVDPAYGSPNTTNNPAINSNFQISGFFVTNIRAGVKVWERGSNSFTLTLNLNNVFDTKYRQAYSQQQRQAAGFNVVVGGRLTF